MKKVKLLIAALVVLLALNPLFAEESSRADEEFFPDFTLDDELGIAGASHQPFALSYGGWLTPIIADDRFDGKELTASINTVRLWLHSTLWENAYFYVRGRNTYTRVIKESGFTDLDTWENIPDLDLAYLSMSAADGAVNLQAGRKFFVLGTGLVLNGRGDGTELRFFTPFADLKLFGLYTGLLRKDFNPYGLSSRELSDGAKRVFAGGSLEKNIINQTLYIMAMYQKDMADEEKGETNRYDSGWYGGGIKGDLIDGMDYYGEFIYQIGKNTLENADDDVKAMAAIAGINYFPDAPFNPGILLQYAWGSGDSNTQKGDDETFRYFGTYVGGFALRPALENIHILRAGASITPLYTVTNPRLRQMTLIGRYSYYMKDKKESDAGGTIGATENEKFIGHGIDASIRWRIYEDLALFVNYGYFITGDAFPSSADDRSFVMAGMNISF